MVLNLKDINTVSSGVMFCSQIEVSKGKSVRAIQTRELGDDNFIHLSERIRIDHANSNPSQLVKRKDIVFRTRGSDKYRYIFK